MLQVAILLGALLCTRVVNAHIAAFAPGMYCLNGPQTTEDLNSYAIVYPLYQHTREDWWMHHMDNCDNFPPADGEFLEIPSGGSFTVELASNRAKTTLSYNGQYTSEWPDGGQYPEDYHETDCIISPNLHTENQTMAAGTAFAISYESDIKAVTPENLVVFSVLYLSPWKRLATYQAPDLPTCPPGGCHCVWGWVPDGCGQPNMYMEPFRCNVTGATSTTPLATAQPPVWCEGNPDSCVKGAKQMIFWNQLEGNNIEVDGWDLSGRHKSPAYNMKLGFADGRQTDIFGGADTVSSSSSSTSSGSDSKPSSSASDSKSPSSGSDSKSPSSSGNPPSRPASSGSTTASSNTPANNGTTSSTSSSPRCRNRRSTPEEVNLVKKSSIAHGIASHLKRRHARQLF